MTNALVPGSVTAPLLLFLGRRSCRSPAGAPQTEAEGFLPVDPPHRAHGCQMDLSHASPGEVEDREIVLNCTDGMHNISYF